MEEAAEGLWRVIDVAKLPMLPTTLGTTTSKTMEKLHEFPMEKPPITPLEFGKLSNSATTTPPADPKDPGHICDCANPDFLILYSISPDYK